MSDKVDESIASTDLVGETDDVVIHISWVHALVGLVFVLGVAGALTAGLWFGRSHATTGTSGAQARVTTGRQTQSSQPDLVKSPQPQSVPRAQSSETQSRSSAGVTTSVSGVPNVGDVAPDFTLKNLQGEKVSLSDFGGRPVLINFWATWCPPCRFEMPAIQKMYEQYQGEDFIVLAVDVQEPISAVKRYVEQGGYTFPVLLDYKGEVANGSYRIRAFPTSYFVGPDGKIAAAHRGMMTEQVLQRYVDQVLSTGTGQ